MQDRDWIESENRTDAPTLDRVWAATRPRALSGDEFDRIWANVQQAHDERLDVLPMVAPRRGRRAFAWVPFGLANAAAVLIAVSVMNAPTRVDHPRLALSKPEPVSVESVSPKFDLEPFETLVIQIDGDVVKNRLDKAADPSLSLAFNDLPTVNQNDTLNHWEALSND